MPATTLLLVRHAETADNVALRLSGWTDADLSPLGEEQIKLLARHVNDAHRHAVALYASPLIRARRTAEGIGRLTGHTPVLLDDLREMHFGELEGLAYADVRESHAHLLEGDENVELDDFTWPSGESRSGFTERVRRVVDEIAGRHPSEDAIVVTHGGVIATFLTIVNGQSAATWRQWIVPNASLTEVAWDPATRRGTLLRHGDAGHLGRPDGQTDG